MPRFIVSSTDRLDKVLAAGAQISRSAAHRQIEAGHVRVNGVAIVSCNHHTQSGDVIECDAPSPEQALVQPEALALDIVYEDDAIVVINKASGMVVHPGAGIVTGTVLNALLAHAPSVAHEMDDDQRQGIVHRLDKETSGVMVLAKTQFALKGLQAQFKARSIRKTYMGLCIGRVMPERAIIDKPLARDPRNRMRMAVHAGGREASTEFMVLSSFQGKYTLLTCHPRTGRTHQIRVHLASIDYPIVGDGVYGGVRVAQDALSKSLAPRHLLHAQRLAFVHPVEGSRCEFEAPLPQDFSSVIARLEQGSA